jgi:hypothetical protein
MPCYSFMLEGDYCRKREQVCKFRPKTGHERPKGEWRYSSTLSLTSALHGVGGKNHGQAALPTT